MAKQVRAPRSTGKIRDERVTSDRNKVKGASLPKGKHDSPHSSNTYKPSMLKPTKRG